MKEKDLKKSKKLLINRVASKEDDDELKKLKELKKKIKKAKTIEELEEIEGSLEKMGIFNLDIINKTVLVGKLFKSKERDRKLQELLNRSDTSGEHLSEIPSERIRDKDKELKKEMEERENQAKKRKERGERSR